MRESSAGRILVHFTPKVSVIGSILQRGLLLVPSPRGLIREFIDDPEFEDKEPQEFGMVSFTELGPSDLRKHRSTFGPLGVALYLDRAIALGAQRVVYVPHEGPMFQTLRWLFRLGHQELLRSREERPGMGMTATNKRLAAIAGAQLWANLLTLYEYLQPEGDAGEVEWRIVNQIPYHHTSRDREEQIDSMLRLPIGWSSICAVRLEPADLAGIITPASGRKALESTLPAEFQKVPVIVADYEVSGEELREQLPARSGPESASQGPPPGESPGPLGRELPAVKRFEKGTAVYHDAVSRDSRFTLSYIDENDERNTMMVPLAQALELLRFLYGAVRDPRFLGAGPNKNR